MKNPLVSTIYIQWDDPFEIQGVILEAAAVSQKVCNIFQM